MPIRLVKPSENAPKTQPTILLFYRASCIFSNFHPAEFWVEINGEKVYFNCSEQYFMYQKAMSVGHTESGERILKMVKPLLMKKAGRKVKMDQKALKKWSETSSETMKTGLIAKFSQNPELLQNLFRTRNMILAEASPRDKLWGIGLGVSNKLSEDPKTWKGSNKLGMVLGEVRDELWEKEEFRKIRVTVEKEGISKRCRKLEKLQ